MLLAIDVGNTNIVLGVYKEAKLLNSWRLGTNRTRTSDEYGALVQNLFNQSGIKLDDIKSVAISSVVPPVNRDLGEFAKKFFKVEAFFVSAKSDMGMTIQYDSPSDVGADRICNAVGAYHKYKCPLIVVDYGTATTFDLIDENGDYLGGAIAPGINISMNALFANAARLFPVEFKAPPSAIGKNMVNSMQSGAVFGFIGQTEALIKKISEEMLSILKSRGSTAKIKVVATGGLAVLIQKESSMIDAIDDKMTLEGIRIIFERSI
ncbi:MAG: type III pantothenate kinase [Alphaproteobacteria bacterium]|nr:type III pantothenate kinase [Alphaproteobacteria bacterium]MCL2505374.1 type III pantothenate kinase [Alphaproteobacteria bacterium]